MSAVAFRAAPRSVGHFLCGGAPVSHLDRFKNFLHLHAARAFHEEQVSARDERFEKFACLLRTLEKLRTAGGVARLNRRTHEIRRMSSHPQYPVEFAQSSSRATTFAV